MGGDVEHTEGGDPVCWLDRVCPQCGAFRESPAPRCVRCGTRFPGTDLGGDGDGDGSDDDVDRTLSPEGDGAAASAG
jgi:hypothetical protein